MKKRTLSILIASLVCLFTSCSSHLEKENVPGENKVGITFTLSMNHAAPASRNLSPDGATPYENTIQRNQFRVLAYTPDGTTHEVTIFSMEEMNEGTYQISGELKGINNINKVVILANCINGSTTFPYSRTDFNPENPNSYIPMWGVKKIATPLEPGINTHIGTIHLLRALAKIQVNMTDGSLSKLTSVSITQHNNLGACIPGTAESLNETTNVTETTIPAGATMGGELTFFPMNNAGYVLYLPEYENKNNPDCANLLVTVKDQNGIEYKKTIAFGKYSGGVFTNERWDILRNHFYTFALRLDTAADGDLTLEVKTEKYTEFTLQPTYGN